VQKVQVEASDPSGAEHVNLGFIAFDSGSPLTRDTHCVSITNGGIDASGELINAVPDTSTMVDPSGASAIPAAKNVQFALAYNNCHISDFPSSLSLLFEATILAPMGSTVSMCVYEAEYSSSPCSSG
jgi:hypothetical protein